jgi:predicted MPP superfamily phosphohydrolase
MKLIWLTDIHLNFLDVNAREKFYHEIADTYCDAVLISGDIAEAPSITKILKEVVNKIKKPIYFVLGNHDYYRGEISEVKKRDAITFRKRRITALASYFRAAIFN